MVGAVLHVVAHACAQSEALRSVEGSVTVPLWLFLSAIVGLCGVIGVMWRADQQGRTRISSEFAEKDRAILDISTKITASVERFIAALDKLAERVSSLVAEARAHDERETRALETISQRLENLERVVTRERS